MILLSLGLRPKKVEEAITHKRRTKTSNKRRTSPKALMIAINQEGTSCNRISIWVCKSGLNTITGFYPFCVWREKPF